MFSLYQILFLREFLCVVLKPRLNQCMDSMLKCPNCMIVITTTFDLQNSRTGLMGVLSLECQ